MLSEDLENLIATITERGDCAYTSPTGAFLELLSKFARENKIDIFALACEIYIQRFPNVAKFIQGRVPGILCNALFTIDKEIDFEAFIQWSLLNTNWDQGLKENFSSPSGLCLAIDEIRSNVNA